VFSGNRVFAAAPAEPPQGRGFVPWGFVDTLVEVELVHEASWQQVFDVGEETRRGLEVWRARCQTCHGARGAGASFGWDFVQPLPLSTWRTPDGLFTHVRAHKLEAPARRHPRRDRRPARLDVGAGDDDPAPLCAADAVNGR
jgi:hypothetical protein